MNQVPQQSSGDSEDLRGAPVGAALVRSVLDFWAARGRRTDLPILGTSMWPVLRSGQTITVRHAIDGIRVGQVVVILQEGRTIAHRVIAVRRTGHGAELRTKGDSTFAADPGWAGVDRIVGVVEAVAGSPAGRIGLSGISGWMIARLSRLQGNLCRPWAAMRGRHARRSTPNFGKPSDR
jgi:signal peptidase I